MTEILSNANFSAVLHALEQRTGAETLAEPEPVTTAGPGANRINRMAIPDKIDIPTLTTNAAESAKLVQDGKLLYEMGKFEDAEAKLKAALALYPDNQAAHYYLALIEQSRQARTSGGPKLIYPRLDNSLNNLSNRAADAQSGDTMVFQINQPMKEDDLKKHLLDAGVKIPPTVFVFTPAGILLVRGSDKQLALVERAVQKLNGFSPNADIGLPVPNPSVTNNNVHTSPGREMIYRKLNSLRLESVSWSDGRPLSEVIRYLAEQSRLRDPDKKGIQFLFNPNVAAGTTATNAAPETVDLNTINVKLVVNDVSLHEVLDAVMLVADRPIRYTVEDYAVVISPKPTGLEPPMLEMRVFRVDTNTFVTALRKIPGVQADNVTAMAESVFSKLGVDLTAPGRSITFNDRLG